METLNGSDFFPRSLNVYLIFVVFPIKAFYDEPTSIIWAINPPLKEIRADKSCIKAEERDWTEASPLLPHAINTHLETSNLPTENRYQVKTTVILL